MAQLAAFTGGALLAPPAQGLGHHFLGKCRPMGQMLWRDLYHNPRLTLPDIHRRVGVAGGPLHHLGGSYPHWPAQ